jgi:hypothetical protein
MTCGLSFERPSFRSTLAHADGLVCGSANHSGHMTSQVAASQWRNRAVWPLLQKQQTDMLRSLNVIQVAIADIQARLTGGPDG